MPNPVMTNGFFGWFAGPESELTEQQWSDGPSLAALQALVNHSAGIKVDGTDFNVEASEQVDDRSFADQAGAQSRGPVQASGNIEVHTPGRGDTSSVQAKAYAAFGVPRTRLAVLNRPVVPQSAPIAAGQEINLFRCITDDRAHNRNDASRTLGVGLVFQDNAHINYIVPAAVPTAVAVTPASPIAAVLGVPKFLKAVYQGRNVTVGARYISSDESVFIVTNSGIIIPQKVGTATLTVTVPGSAAGTPITVNVAAS